MNRKWFRIQQIGYLDRREGPLDDGFVDPAEEAVIVIDPHWQEGLASIDGYSHLVVLFYFDRVSRRRVAGPLRSAEGTEDLPPVGFFATRSPRRPNPVMICCPRLIRREENRLVVRGVDAWHRTPVIDVRGYSPRDELQPDAAVPEWLSRLWQRHDRERR